MELRTGAQQHSTCNYLNGSKCQIENNTLCVYAIGFRRSPMLEYMYNGHSIVIKISTGYISDNKPFFPNIQTFQPANTGLCIFFLL